MAKEYWIQKNENGKWATVERITWDSAADQKCAQTRFNLAHETEGGCWRLCVVDVRVEDSLHSCCDDD